MQENNALMPSEIAVPGSSVALGRHNYAVLLKDMGFVVRSIIEQRYAAIRVGGTGATTLLYREGAFAMPDSSQDPLKKEGELRRDLMENLKPQDGDVVIICGCAMAKAAKLAAKTRPFCDHNGSRKAFLGFYPRAVLVVDVDLAF